MTSLLNWLGETPAQKASNGTPGYLSMGMSGKVFLIAYSLRFTLMLISCSNGCGSGMRLLNRLEDMY